MASYLFDAWGSRQVNSSDPTATSDPYSGYNTAAGYFTDWETGLQMLGHRYYDPATGRFLNRDPIGMAGGINLYEYAGNSPIGRSDPSGLDWIDCMATCIQRHDPLNNWLKGGLFIVGGPIPKALVRLIGVRVIILPGSSRLTTIPSVCQLQFGWPIRSVGRIFFWVFIGYGLYLGYWELHCLAECLGDPDAY